MLNKQLAKAKINLCLHVTGQNMEGYHLLDSLVAFANYGDELVFHDNEKIEIVSEGKFGKDLSNIKIQKNIIFKKFEFIIWCKNKITKKLASISRNWWRVS
ncbi:hypothetical protein N9565_01600 [Amylibacter sp.]|nr:hypothetical protein [Amylibacter sp.]